MSPSHSRLSPPPPELFDELVLEVLLRIPPDQPECLVRASCVSKAWRRVLSSAAFRLRYGDFHRTPPMLGLLCNEPWEDQLAVRFVPTTAFRPRSTPGHDWVLIDARHGRVLFLDITSCEDLVIWDPNTVGHRRVPITFYKYEKLNHFAVLCATAGCNHRSCRSGPFIVVILGKKRGESVTNVHVYSSESGAWTAAASIEHPDSAASVPLGRSVLVEDTLYIPWGAIIMGYDMGNQQLRVINKPSGCNGLGALITVGDGMQCKMGLATVQESQLHLWWTAVGGNEAVAWKQDRVIDLETLLPIRGLLTNPNVAGSADGVAVIFISTDVGLFTIELKSDRVRKVSSSAGEHFVFPYTSFYTPDHAT